MASHALAPCAGGTWLSGARSSAPSASPRQLTRSRRGIRKKCHALSAQTSLTSSKDAEVKSGKGLRDLNCEAVLASNSNDNSSPYSDLRGGANEARTAAGGGGGISRRQLIIPAVIAAVFSPCKSGWGAGEDVPLGAQDVREVRELTSRNESDTAVSGDVLSEYERRLTPPDERDESDDEEGDVARLDETPSPLFIDEARDEGTVSSPPAVELSIPEPPPSIAPITMESVPIPPVIPEVLPPAPMLPPVPPEPAALSSLIQDLKFFARDLAFGAVAGGVGAGVVYPIDFVKTRMQAQREPLHSTGLPMQAPKYRNGWDCFATVVREDGVLALYDGLLPQMVGVAPEKAIKLSVNSFLRRTLVVLTNVPRDSMLPVHLAFLAGGMSGLAQIVVANPLEMVKVRLQMQGRVIQLAEERLRAAMAAADAATGAAGKEGAASVGVPVEGTGDPGSAQLVLVKETSVPVAPVVLPTVPKRQTAMDVIHELGFAGLYRASGSTMMRDFVFNAMYFSAYGVLRDAPWATAWGIWGTVLAGTLAGVPSAYLATPMDVVKTRLQICDKSLGEKPYDGIWDCYAKIIQEEGWPTLFKGGGFRVLRSAPQFGVTLAVFEVLFKIFE